MGIFPVGMTAILGLLTFGAALSRTAQLRTHSPPAVHRHGRPRGDAVSRSSTGKRASRRRSRSAPCPDSPTSSTPANPVQIPTGPLEYRVDVELSWKSAGVQREERVSPRFSCARYPSGGGCDAAFVEGDMKALASPRECGAAPEHRQGDKP
jgi:hypothetical protein